jgi:hypothetical protein
MFAAEAKQDLVRALKADEKSDASFAKKSMTPNADASTLVLQEYVNRMKRSSNLVTPYFDRVPTPCLCSRS